MTPLSALTGEAAAAAAATPPAVDVGLLAFLVVGALGSVHCLGMCGPLVTMYAERYPDDGRGPTFAALRQHLLFNAGRTASYVAIGAAMGALGSLLVDAGRVFAVGNAVRGVAGLLAGAVIVAAGLGYLAGGIRGVDAVVPRAGGAFAVVAGRLRERVDAWATDARVAGLGAAHGLLPCPLLYPAFLYAFATGSPVDGALALAALGVGTVPTLFLYGTILDSIGTPTRRRLHRALGLAFVLAGTIPLANGLRALGYRAPHLPLPMPPFPG